MTYPVLHTEMWLGGANREFTKCKGGGDKGVYDVLTLQKSRGGQELT